MLNEEVKVINEESRMKSLMNPSGYRADFSFDQTALLL
jgi:hypothetical protein